MVLEELMMEMERLAKRLQPGNGFHCYPLVRFAYLARVVPLGTRWLHPLPEIHDVFDVGILGNRLSYFSCPPIYTDAGLADVDETKPLALTGWRPSGISAHRERHRLNENTK
jgi:hypothetical protein